MKFEGLPRSSPRLRCRSRSSATSFGFRLALSRFVHRLNSGVMSSDRVLLLGR